MTPPRRFVRRCGLPAKCWPPSARLSSRSESGSSLGRAAAKSSPANAATLSTARFPTNEHDRRRDCFNCFERPPIRRRRVRSAMRRLAGVPVEAIRETNKRRYLNETDEPKGRCGMTTLQAYLRDYLEARELCQNYVYLMQIALRRFEEFLGRGATLDDLTSETINRYIDRLLERGLSKHTVHSYKQAIKRLWIDAYESHVIDRPPTRVRKIKGRREPTKAWTPDQVRRLLEVAGELKGNFQRTRINRAAFWRAFVLTAWDTGLRPCDLMRLKLSDINEEGRGAIIQEKTGSVVHITLRPATMEAIRATRPEHREFIFGGVVSNKGFYKGMKKLTKAAGTWGGLYRVRKGAASALECEHPGFAGRFLGHRTPGLAERHYLDPRIVNRDRPLPPALPPSLEESGGAE